MEKAPLGGDGLPSVVTGVPSGVEGPSEGKGSQI